MTEIRPRFVDGEPVCAGKDCPVYFKGCEWAQGMIPSGDPCLPAYRHLLAERTEERDEARKHLCEAVSAIANKEDGKNRSWKATADVMEWSYLYEDRTQEG